MKKETEPKGWNILCTCRGEQEHFDMLGIICYLQGHYRDLKLFKRRTWFKGNSRIHKWAKQAIKEYKGLQNRPFDDEVRAKKQGKTRKQKEIRAF